MANAWMEWVYNGVASLYQAFLVSWSEALLPPSGLVYTGWGWGGALGAVIKMNLTTEQLANYSEEKVIQDITVNFGSAEGILKTEEI